MMEPNESQPEPIDTYQRKKILIPASIIIALVIVGLFLAILLRPGQKNSEVKSPVSQSPVPSVEPSAVPFSTYQKPTVAKQDQYDIFLLGDSMTHAFGPRGGKFAEILSATEPGNFYEVFNYAQANQSVLTLPDQIKQPVQADQDLLLKPVLEGSPDEPDLIIIESFGYNPLSQLGKEAGLKKQEEVLTETLTILTNRYPHTAVMFLAAIAPDKLTYGRAVTKSDQDARWAQAEERIEYITNHIKYAREHNIPVINAYEESLDSQGDGDTRYINPTDNIHPSEEGLALMGRVMARRINEENIFPKP